MAVYNEIGIGRWNRFIQKITDIKGSPPARQLMSEIGFVHQIFHGAENRYLESWDRFGLSFQVGAVAANESALQLRNPAGSNVIAVFEKVEIANVNAAASQFFVSSGPGADLAVPQAPGTNIWRLDPRGRLSPTLLLSTQNTTPAVASLLAQTGNVLMPANTTYDSIQDAIHEFPTLPGESMRIVCNNVNTALAVCLMWRERFLEPSERT